MIVPQSIFDLYNQTTSDMISSNFGVPCTLVYGSNRIECPNCLYNPVGKSSTGQYKSGGPIPFTNVVCPYCAGVGYSIVDHIETIKMRVYWKRGDFMRVEVPITITNSSIQSIGYITDLPKIQRAQEIIANNTIQGYVAYRYVLAGEPLPFGLGSDKKYFVAFWNRNQ